MFDYSYLISQIYNESKGSPDKIALVQNDQTISYSELYLNILKWTSFLIDRGLGKGDVIILGADKNFDFIFIYLATKILGIISVIIDPKSNSDRIFLIEQLTNPKIGIGYLSSSIPSYSYDSLFFKVKQEYIPSLSSNIKNTDITEILFTTGTTGESKGVLLTYSNIDSTACNINDFIGNSSSDIELLALPLCHSFGLGRLRCNLIANSTVVLESGFADVKKLFEDIEKYKVTFLSIVPAAWAYIRKISGKRISKFADQIKFMEIGSAYMPLSVKQEIISLLPNTKICMHYGLTEASRSCFLDFNDVNHLDSIGKAVNENVDIKIIDEKGEEIAINETGEICIKGNNVSPGYINNSNQSFWNDYVRTGDTGYMTIDGYVYLIGRQKELINVGGKKVSPQEIEDTLAKIGVNECICTAIPDPKGVLGEVVKCYILNNSTSLTFLEIDQQIRSFLEGYKCPAEYEWIDKIPATESGKKIRTFNK